jgi:phenylacetate-coenzyme A ligase PaaK-like adenylate-forming protein
MMIGRVPEAELLANERLDLAALRELQLARLQSSVRACWTGNAAYRSKCDAAGVTPDDIRTLADLARFPFTSKTDLRETYPFMPLRGRPASRPSSATRSTTSRRGPAWSRGQSTPRAAGPA